VWKLELGTYEREVERYGGAAGIEPAERLFHADSEAVTDVVRLLAGDAAADLRWRLALVGLDRLLADFALRGEAAEAVLETMQGAFAREHGAGADLKKQMSDRLRKEGEGLERLLDAGDDPSHPLAPALAVFRRRSRALRPVVAELAAAQRNGRLDLSLPRLVPSFAHMFMNRLLRSNGRAQELVIYDFLLRLSHSRRMRARSRAGRQR
jgi:thiopeptide-type bacteriocin biosynthesis protein